MSKTLQLISKYFSLLGEQAPEGDLAAGIEPATATASAPPAEPQVQVSNIDENEKYIIKILTNAFIFNPTLFNKQKQKYIFNKIDQIKRMVNVPVARIVDEVKSVIAIDRSLKVESKTLSLLAKYMLLIEQPADATEPQADTQPTQNSSTSQSQEKIIDGEGNNLNLAEIFPLYKELILKALKHAPTDDELMIIKPVVNEFADSDPEKIVETIQNILSQSLEDKEVEDNLSNA
jgi:hypothetical protein